jgi:protease II
VSTALPVSERTAAFDRWFSYPRASAPSVAHDGATVYLLSDRGGLPQAWSVPRSGGEPALFVGGRERVGRVVPRPNAPGAIVTVDRGGDEHYQLTLVDEHGRHLRAVTDDPKRIHHAGAWNDAGSFYFTSNARDVRFFDVYAIDPHASTPPQLVRAEDATADLVDVRDDRLLLLRSNTNIDRDLLLRTGATETNLLPHDDEVAVWDAAFGPDRIYAAANPGREFTAVLACPFSGGTPETLVAFDGDVEHLALDRPGRTLLLAYNDRGRSRLAVHSVATGATAEVELPHAGVVGTLAAVPGTEEFVFDLSSPEVGTEVYAVDAAEGSVRRLTHGSRPFPGVKAHPKLGETTASDGLRVPFWWYEPPSGARATVVYVHGGPEAQSRPGFLPLFGFLLEQRFRVIAPNVRGSLGYGRTYLHLDDVRRRMDSVRDLAEVVGAIRDGRTEVPIRPGERIGVIGGSYGGFMVLSAITTYPELFDAAVDVVGIANFVTFLERTGPWRRKLREDEYGRLDRDRAFLESISPIHRADRIISPLMVVHGVNDPRVPLYEAEQIVGALRGRGVPVEFLVYDNEGHGLVRRENQREAYVRAAEFFDRHLAGGGSG